MTALAHDALPGWEPTPGCVPPGSGRPVLRLVPSGQKVRRPQTGSSLRISRFGRLLLTAMVVGAVVALAVTLLAPAAGSVGAGIDHTVTVESGQTLSGIADSELPALPIAEGVAQIRLANGLNTSQVHAGQQLAIPRIG